MGIADEIATLFRTRGDSQYGREAVTQREHALQAASAALAAHATPAAITAALLHDVGHLLHALPEDAPDHGIDDRHEALGAHWLTRRFGPEVVEPVRLHVAAKRYLVATDAAYAERLSAPSRQSLALQGGPMTAVECRAFAALPQFTVAIALRRWDDAAKVPGLATPPLEQFLPLVMHAAGEQPCASG